jgi:hypothetical protein
LIVFGSHQFDWDHFYTSTEADLRSLLLFHEWPLWSYSFCAGVTRIADPQAISLSPLFLFHVLWGPMLGHKIMIVALSLLGIVYFKKALDLFFDVDDEVLWSFSFLTFTSHFFIWHMIAGHVTFSFFSLGIIISYYFLKESQTLSFSWKRSLALAFSIFTLFTSSFYPVLVYFFLPLNYYFLEFT